VGLALVDEARSGALAFNLGATVARVAAAFVMAMALGSAIGLLMGRSPIANRLGDPWLIVLLNLPALVIIVLAYIWAGLTETAAVAAVGAQQTSNRGGDCARGRTRPRHGAQRGTQPKQARPQHRKAFRLQ
jgi:ABC-type dipeptide/oligopeptide/nickel transport system permease component